MTGRSRVPPGRKAGAAAPGSRRIVREGPTTTFASVAAEVMKSAKASGLTGEKDSRISGRVSSVLVDRAKRRTGITENTQLIEFALASIALDDEFAEVFESVEGAVDPGIKLGF